MPAFYNYHKINITHDQYSWLFTQKVTKRLLNKCIKKTNQASIDLWFNQLGKKLLCLNLKRNRCTFISFLHKFCIAKITSPWNVQRLITWESCAESSDSGWSSSWIAVKECLRSKCTSHYARRNSCSILSEREKERVNLFPDKWREEFKQSSSPRWKLRRDILNWHSFQMKTMYFLSKRIERKIIFIIPSCAYYYNRESLELISNVPG